MRLTMPLGALFLLLSLAMSFSPSQCLSVKKRLDFLELQVSSISLSTKTEIMGLKEAIEGLLNTTGTGAGAYGDYGTGVQQVDSEEVQAVLMKMEEFVSKQTERMAALEKAFGDEKTRSRKVIDALADVDTNNVPNEQVQQSIAKLNTRLDKANFQRNMSAGAMLGKIGDLTTLVERLSGRLDTLEETGVQAHGGAAPKPPCPSGWTLRQKTCYLFVTKEKVMWDVANMLCHDLGGKLAEPETEAATRHVMSLTGSSGEAWLGATDDESEGTWVWFALRKEVDFLQWERGQPNNLGKGQNCLELYKGNMNDETCTASNNYVCQKDANVA